jgi:hypothetical protein
MELSEDCAYNRETREDRGWDQPITTNANIECTCRSIRSYAIYSEMRHRTISSLIEAMLGIAVACEDDDSVASVL